MGRHAGPPITQAQVDGLPLGCRPPKEIYDGAVPGLSVRALADRKVYRLKVDMRGAVVMKVQPDGTFKQQTKEFRPIGYADQISLTEARRLATIAKGEVLEELGDATSLQRKARLETITLAQAWDRYIQGGKFPRGRDQKPLKQTTIDLYEDNLRLHFGHWRDKKVVDLAKDRDGFKAWYLRLANRVPGSARTVLKQFNAVWTDLRRAFPELAECPATVLAPRDKPKNRPRQIAYRPDELPPVTDAIWRAGRFRAGVHLIYMLSGCRKTGVFSARREDYHREEGYLFLADHKGKEDIVPLSPVMISVLDAMLKLGDRYFPGNPYLFCAYSKSGHISDAVIKAPPPEAQAAHRAKRGFKQRQEISTHHWRNSWVSMAPMAGLSGRDARQMIGHSTGREDAHEGYATPILSHLIAQQTAMSDFLMKHAGFPPGHRFELSWFSGTRELDAIEGLI